MTPAFAWDEPAYHLEGDTEVRTFAEILVDVVVTEVIEPWGGGKWHLEAYHAAHPGRRRLDRRSLEPRPAAIFPPETMGFEIRRVRVL